MKHILHLHLVFLLHDSPHRIYFQVLLLVNNMMVVIVCFRVVSKSAQRFSFFCLPFLAWANLSYITYIVAAGVPDS